jgi:hypothetical protein
LKKIQSIFIPDGHKMGERSTETQRQLKLRLNSDDDFVLKPTETLMIMMNVDSAKVSKWGGITYINVLNWLAIT